MNRLSVLLALTAPLSSAFVLPEGPWEHHWAVIVAGSPRGVRFEISNADAARLPGDDDGPVVLPGALR